MAGAERFLTVRLILHSGGYTLRERRSDKQEGSSRPGLPLYANALTSLVFG